MRPCATRKPNAQQRQSEPLPCVLPCAAMGSWWLFRRPCSCAAHPTPPPCIMIQQLSCINHPRAWPQIEQMPTRSQWSHQAVSTTLPGAGGGGRTGGRSIPCRSGAPPPTGFSDVGLARRPLTLPHSGATFSRTLTSLLLATETRMEGSDGCRTRGTALPSRRLFPGKAPLGHVIWTPGCLSCVHTAHVQCLIAPQITRGAATQESAMHRTRGPESRF